MDALSLFVFKFILTTSLIELIGFRNMTSIKLIKLERMREISLKIIKCFTAIGVLFYMA